MEYLRTVSRAGSEQTIWWYRSMLEILAARSDWPRREMLAELRVMSADLVRSLRQQRGGAVSAGVGRSRWSCSAGCLAPGAAGRPSRSIRSASCSINDVYVADTMADGQGGLARVATVRDAPGRPGAGRCSSWRATC